MTKTASVLTLGQRAHVTCHVCKARLTRHRHDGTDLTCRCGTVHTATGFSKGLSTIGDRLGKARSANA